MAKYLFMSAEVENEEQTGRDHTAVALNIELWMRWLPELHWRLNSVIDNPRDAVNGKTQRPLFNGEGRVSIWLSDGEVRLAYSDVGYDEYIIEEEINTEWCDHEEWEDVWLHFYRGGIMQITGLFGGTGIAMYTPRFTLDEFEEKQNA